MKSVKFSLYLKSPIASPPEDCFYQNRFILPGSMLRGALATHYLAVRGKDSDFDEIFIEGENQFPFLFPVDRSGEPMRKAPKTAAACKRKGKKHGIVSTIGDLMESTILPQCPECKQDVKPMDDYLGDDPMPVKRSYVGHTAIHEKTNTALPHAFFRELLLDPEKVEGDGRAHFCGYGRLSEKSHSLLSEICRDHTLMLGKSKTRGKGWGRLEIKEAGQELERKALEDKNRFTIHCITPLIVLDEFLRPSTRPLIEWRGECLRPVYLEVATVFVRGWSVVHGLPKMEDVAVDMGSVFIFDKTEPLKNDEVFAGFAGQLEEIGLGERKIEGFGKIKIDDAIVIDPQEVHHAGTRHIA